MVKRQLLLFGLIMFFAFTCISMAALSPSKGDFAEVKLNLKVKEYAKEDLEAVHFKNKVFDDGAKDIMQRLYFNTFTHNEIAENYFLTDRDRASYEAGAYWDRSERRDRENSYAWSATKKLLKYHLLGYFRDPKEDWLKRTFGQFKARDSGDGGDFKTSFTYLVDQNALELGLTEEESGIKNRLVFYPLKGDLMLDFRKDMADNTYSSVSYYVKDQELSGKLGMDVEKNMNTEVRAVRKFGDNSTELVMAMNYRF